MADSRAMNTSQTRYVCLEDRKVLKLLQRIERKLKERPPKAKTPQRLAS